MKSIDASSFIQDYFGEYTADHDIRYKHYGHVIQINGNSIVEEMDVLSFIHGCLTKNFGMKLSGKYTEDMSVEFQYVADALIGMFRTQYKYECKPGMFLTLREKTYGQNYEILLEF